MIAEALPGDLLYFLALAGAQKGLIRIWEDRKSTFFFQRVPWQPKFGRLSVFAYPARAVKEFP
jgi:hypothetical protein